MSDEFDGGLGVGADGGEFDGADNPQLDDAGDGDDDATPNVSELVAQLHTQLAQTREELAQLKESNGANPNVLEPHTFFDADTHTNFLADPETANQVMNALVERIEQRLMQNVQPTILQTVVAQQEQARLRGEFYKANKDLVAHEPVVREIANQLAKENPNLSVEESFKQIARVARKRLGLDSKPKNGNQQQQQRRNPGFAGVTGARGGAGTPQGTRSQTLADEIAAMLAGE